MQRGKFDPGDIVIQPPHAEGQLDLAAIFGNTHLVELEIGSGKGGFILARSTERPDLNFLGIEYEKTYCYYAADRARRAGLENMRMLCCDAGPLLARGIPEASIWRLHVYFPDPWPKRRHRRRRLIQPPFVENAKRVLAPGGQLLIVTDHEDYFRQICSVLADVSGLANIPLPRLSSDENEVVGTNFERKYAVEGRRFYSIARLRYGS